MGFTSSRGKRPARLHSSIMGTRLSSMNFRVLSRTRRSSSESKESNSMKSTFLNLKGGIQVLDRVMSETDYGIRDEQLSMSLLCWRRRARKKRRLNLPSSHEKSNSVASATAA